MTINRSSLPSNVRRWLDRSFPTNAPVPNRILNTQEGEMDIRGKWMPFTAKTFNQVQPFTFIWKARFNMIPGIWLIAEDGHDKEDGAEQNSGELFQWAAVKIQKYLQCS